MSDSNESVSRTGGRPAGGLDPWRLGRFRTMAGRRWWVWFAAFAALAVVHDWWHHAAPAVLRADAEPTAGAGNEGAEGEHADEGHVDPAAPVLLAIVLILFAAKIAGDVFERMRLPAVLGELAVGVLLGNLSLLGFDALDFLKPPPAHEAESEPPAESVATAPGAAATGGEEEHGEATAYDTGAVLYIFASIGVILLLFEVGLESSVKDMMSVGLSSLVVAVLGVVAPIILGYAVGMWLLPEDFVGGLRHAASAFLGATLCATSVGITARVLKDLGRSQQRESRIILGAAVVDDVLGLVVLAIVSGIIQATGQQIDAASAEAGGSALAFQVAKIVLLAFGFIAGALVLGAMRFPRALFKLASHLKGHGLLVATALAFCFSFSVLANLMGLATIVGAFAAGLILENAHYRELGRREDHELEEAIAPISGLFVPIFFVQMGIQVRLESFANPSVWALAGGLTLVAILGKQVCALGVTEKGLNRLAVGLGMIPRGEVGLIFANEGRSLQYAGVPVIGDATYSAIIVMIMVTTMVTPPLLKWALDRGDAPPAEEPGEAVGHPH